MIYLSKQQFLEQFEEELGQLESEVLNIPYQIPDGEGGHPYVTDRVKMLKFENIMEMLPALTRAVDAALTDLDDDIMEVE